MNQVTRSEDALRILVVSDALEIGGIERSLLGMLGPLVDAGHNVDLYLLRHQGELMTALDPRVRLLGPDKIHGNLKTPIRDVFRGGLLRLGVLRVLVKLRSVVVRRLAKPTSQIARLSRWSNWMAADVPGAYDMALGFQGPHDFLLEHVDAKVKVGWAHTDYSTELLDTEFEMPMWAGLDRIAVVSPGVQEAFHKAFPSLAHKTMVVENAFDPQSIAELAIQRVEMEGLDGSSDLTICTVGRFSFAKAFDVAVDACHELVKRGVNVKWMAVGYGPDEENLKHKVSSMGLESHFHFVGKQVNPYPFMKLCDIYVQPSRYEGKAVAVREAQSLGKPVIITDFPTSQFQLIDGHDGLICGMSPADIASAIIDLYNDKRTMEELSSNALASDYSNRAAIADMIHDLRPLLGAS